MKNQDGYKPGNNDTDKGKQQNPSDTIRKNKPIQYVCVPKLFIILYMLSILKTI